MKQISAPARDYRRGEFICQDCGLVLEDIYIDEGPEWRYKLTHKGKMLENGKVILSIIQ